jgi:hypothetical protein
VPLEIKPECLIDKIVVFLEINELEFEFILTFYGGVRSQHKQAFEL